jgi:hypothetical protein
MITLNLKLLTSKIISASKHYAIKLHWWGGGGDILKNIFDFQQVTIFIQMPHACEYDVNLFFKENI